MNGFSIVVGILLPLVFGLVAGVVSDSLGFGIGTTILTVLYATTGFKKVEVGWKAVLTVLGKREQVIFTEGWLWLPKVLADIKPVDCRRRNIVLELPDAQTADDIEVKVNAGAVVFVSDPFQFLSVKDPFGSAGDGETVVDGPVAREIETAIRENITDKGSNIADPDAKKRLTRRSKEIETQVRQVLTKIDRATGEIPKLMSWGLELDRLQIKDIDLPKDVQDAVDARRVEEQRQISKMTETETLAKLAKRLQELFPDMTAEEAMNRVQAERGKITVFKVDGNAGDFTKGAAIGFRPQGGNKK